MQGANRVRTWSKLGSTRAKKNPAQRCFGNDFRRTKHVCQRGCDNAENKRRAADEICTDSSLFNYPIAASCCAVGGCDDEWVSKIECALAISYSLHGIQNTSTGAAREWLRRISPLALRVGMRRDIYRGRLKNLPYAVRESQRKMMRRESHERSERGRKRRDRLENLSYHSVELRLQIPRSGGRVIVFCHRGFLRRDVIARPGSVASTDRGRPETKPALSREETPGAALHKSSATAG